MVEGERFVREWKDTSLLEEDWRKHRLDAIWDERLMPHFAHYAFDPGERICLQGDPAKMLYLLVKGKIKIYTNSPEGKTLILSFRTPLDMIGDVEFVREADILNTVEAVTAVRMMGISYRELRRHAWGDPAFLQFMLERISGKFYEKSLAMSFNLMQPVDVRLASYLLSVAFGDAGSETEGRFKTSGLRDAAGLIGTSYRHLNRVIGQFSSEGLVSRARGYIRIMDREGLRERAHQNIYE